MNRDDAIKRIEKCLRLSKSSNPHEAAAALRQAQALMSQYGVELADVEAAAVGEAIVKSGAMMNPPAWERFLAIQMAECFACTVVFRARWDRGEFVFFGMGANARIAAYAHQVLLRQIRLARVQYIATKLRRCKPARKRARADDFCEGWIIAAAEKAAKLRPSAPEQLAIDRYIESKIGEVKTREVMVGGEKARREDLNHGFAEGEKAQIHHGVDQAAARPQLEAPK